MISKKMTASALALALGASALVAPQALALPSEFVSPPGALGNPEQDDCQVIMEDNVSTSQPGKAREATQSGVSAGVALNQANTEYLAWVTVDRESERIFERARADFEVTNNATKAVTQSFTVKEQQTGALAFDATYDSGSRPDDEKVNLNVTDIIPVDNEQFSVKPGEKQLATAKLGLNNSLDKQTWAWKINQPTSSGQSVTRINSWATVDVAPWTMETDNCQPITASGTKSKPIIADGNEYDTGISVANAANDYKRLTGNVLIGGKKIDKAKVRVDAKGKVYVTLPKNATGGVDNNKPAKVDVQIIANPREGDKSKKYDAYKNSQVLRVVDDLGRVTQDSPKFTGSVPVQKFAPAYPEETAVRPGASVDVKLSKKPGQVRGKDVPTEYVLKSVPQGWKVVVDKASGNLKVTSPKGAKDGDAAKIVVTAKYSDGSSDDITTTVKAQKPTAEIHKPGYGEKKGKVGTKVTLDQTTKNLPKGSTFTITPGQNLGEWKPVVDKNTGKITVTIPKGANPGDQQTILVDVKYPDASTDKKVPAKVTVLNEPEYGEERGWPNDTVILEHEGKAADGSTFEIKPGQDLGDWKPEIDPKTGKITVTIPKGAQPGWKDILVNVTDPNNGGKVETVPARVIVNGKGGNDTPPVNPTDGGNNNVVIIYPSVPGVPNPSEPTTPKDPENPEGGKTVVEIVDSRNVPEGGDVTVGPNGEIYIVVPKDSTPTSPVNITIEVTYPDGTKKTEEIELVIPTLPKDGDTDGKGGTGDNGGDKPGDNQGGGKVIIINPDNKGGGNPDNVKTPEGWKAIKDGDNNYVVTVPEGTKPGTYPVVVPGGKGGNTTVNVTVGRDGGILGSSANREGSSENLSKCFENLSSPSNPLIWLLPLGILTAVGAPLAGPISDELGKAVANVQRQMNVDIPNPFGRVGNNRPQPEFVTQIQVEAARLQQQFGPAVTQAAAVGLALVGLAAGLGILAAVCRNGGEDLASSKKDENAAAGSSSINDLFGGEGSSSKDGEGSSAEGSSSEDAGAEDSAPAGDK